MNYDVNRARNYVGLPSVAWSDDLAACAHTHNVLMSVYGFGHASASELFNCAPWAHLCRENIGWWPGTGSYDVRTDQQTWFNLWWNSPEHQANMMANDVSFEGDDIYVAWNGDVFATMELCS